ncbi:sigma factor-like helix-turn-helix DNA-binding protein [Anaerocolumna aminovalerica]|jgi:RNA polymerase sigma-70 factor (ECF subfamily)|uniref:sigma factor-like helix-turn-helix DNA-binding protein n=1 Tax=Anaerocolumna aminovalerica TaxID=1527 RepID=UPI003AB9714D
MKYVLGISYKEIGEKLNMTPKHVDTRNLRAKEKVRKLVEKELTNKTQNRQRSESE